MTDQNQQNQDNDNTNDNANNNADQADKNVVDIQAKIDSAVKARVAREKEQQKILQQQWDEERKELVEENEFLKKQFQAKIDEQLAELPPSFRSLVSKLDIRSQIEWFNEQAKEQQAKPKTPNIPNFDKKNNDDKKEIQHIPIDRIA